MGEIEMDIGKLNNPCVNCGMTIRLEEEGEFDTLPSVQTIPARWSFTIGISSDEWFGLYWYRWYFDEDAGLMMSKTVEWYIRKFWKISIEP